MNHNIVDALPVDTGKLRKNSNGFLIADKVMVARDGIQIYQTWEMPSELLDEIGRENLTNDEHGRTIVRVYRSLKSLVENLADYEGLPFTDGHAWDDVTVKDRTPVCGLSSNTKKVKKGVTNSLVITDSNCIFDIENENKREVSLGYSTELLVKSGTYNGDAYDVEATDIKPNHIALTAKGRCGPECVINDSISPCDCDGCKDKATTFPSTTKSENDMTKQYKTVSINDEIIEVNETHEPVLAGIKKTLADQQTQIDTLTGENTTLTTQLADAQAELAPEKMLTRVADATRTRSAILVKASGYVTEALDAVDNKTIMLKALDAAGIKDMADKSDAHIEGAFAVLSVKDSATADTGTGTGKGGIGAVFTDVQDSENPDDELEKARKQYRSGSRSTG